MTHCAPPPRGGMRGCGRSGKFTARKPGSCDDNIHTVRHGHKNAISDADKNRISRAKVDLSASQIQDRKNPEKKQGRCMLKPKERGDSGENGGGGGRSLASVAGTGWRAAKLEDVAEEEKACRGYAHAGMGRAGVVTSGSVRTCGKLLMEMWGDLYGLRQKESSGRAHRSEGHCVIQRDVCAGDVTILSRGGPDVGSGNAERARLRDHSDATQKTSGARKRGVRVVSASAGRRYKQKMVAGEYRSRNQQAVLRYRCDAQYLRKEPQWVAGEDKIRPEPAAIMILQPRSRRISGLTGTASFEPQTTLRISVLYAVDDVFGKLLCNRCWIDLSPTS
ncbi:hypothetical protein C8R44DRAFT_741979 [Mycena epipterygia]|nr:hypothetical protein C8R44DRAFT_741979 [Mycena epipterygia]